MTDRELEQLLANAVNRTVPNDLDAILSRCGAQNGSVTEMKELQSNQNIIDVEATEVAPRKKLRPWLAAACAALVLLGAGGGGLIYQQSYAVASVVSLDVNPSIELKVNRGERVISCTALNTEAAAVLFDMDGGADLKGTKVDVAVNAIVGALVREGYLDSISSAILISVEDNDQARAQRLQAELVASVDGVLQAQAPGTSVLSQVLDANSPATEYMTFNSGLSAGKASLVHKVMEMNGTLALNSTDAFDKLAALSVEELNDLLEAGETRIPIGKPAAALAVEEYAGTAALNSTTTDVDPELDENPPHYDVELKTTWGNFDYMVDAFTGEVLSGQKDVLNAAGSGGQGTSKFPDGSENQSTANPMLTETQAYNAAAEHCGKQYPALSGYNVFDIVTKLDWDNGRQVYDVDFVISSYEFDYEIDAYTGKVLKWETDYRTPAAPAPAPETPAPGAAVSSDQDVGEEAAKQAALNNAGLSAADVTNWKVEREWDDGRLEYELEFWCGTTEYDCTVDGYTGSVLKCGIDHHGNSSSGHHSDSHHSQTSTNTSAASDIGQEAAKAAALTHAGVSESQTTKMKVERDWDDGRLEYDVDFRVDRTEYEYTIDGATGAILEYELDTD
ncbi:MAG: hypothetical protein HFF44_08610 [Lawsonibacter sp.]|nr:hypothetical protein [Lawsonibacter sp.]